MPASYQVDPNGRLVRLQFRDEVSLAATTDLLRALGADPALPARVDMLVDLRHSVGLPQSGELRVIVAELVRLGGKLRFGACALVASSDSTYGVSRMFAVYAEPCFGAVQVFRDLGEAEAWLAATRTHPSASTS